MALKGVDGDHRRLYLAVKRSELAAELERQVRSLGEKAEQIGRCLTIMKLVNENLVDSRRGGEQMFATDEEESDEEETMMRLSEDERLLTRRMRIEVMMGVLENRVNESLESAERLERSVFEMKTFGAELTRRILEDPDGKAWPDTQSSQKHKKASKLAGVGNERVPPLTIPSRSRTVIGRAASEPPSMRRPGRPGRPRPRLIGDGGMLLAPIERRELFGE
jgi:hypothetical protein